MLETSRQDRLSHSLRPHIIIIICVRIHSLSAEMSVVISFVLLKLAVLLAPYFESLVWLCLSALLLLPLPTRKLNGEPVITIHHNSSILVNLIFIPFHCISILAGHKFTSLGHWAVAFFFILPKGNRRIKISHRHIYKMFVFCRHLKVVRQRLWAWAVYSHYVNKLKIEE